MQELTAYCTFFLQVFPRKRFLKNLLFQHQILLYLLTATIDNPVKNTEIRVFNRFLPGHFFTIPFKNIIFFRRKKSCRTAFPLGNKNTFLLLFNLSGKQSTMYDTFYPASFPGGRQYFWSGAIPANISPFAEFLKKAIKNNLYSRLLVIPA